MNALIQLLFILAFSRSPAPSQAPPPRDTFTAPAAVGEGSIAGVVTDERDGRPMRRVNVTLSGSMMGPARNASTDENGRFRFAALPLGQFTLTAARPGYVTTSYGSRRPGRGPGQPITLTAAAASANVAIKLPHGAVITGTVTDANGRPAQSVRITVLQYRMAVGERQLVPATVGAGNIMTTDDRGAYRVYGLAAGDYLVGAAPQMTDARLTTPADVQRAQQLVQQAASISATQPVPAGAPAPSPADASGSVGYARIFHPGTPDPAGAATITLQSGDERSGVDFALQYVRTVKIEGVVLDAAGQPSAQAALSVAQPGLPSTMGTWGVQRGQQGRFTVTGALPGDYTITARFGPRGPVPLPSPGATAAATSADVSWAAANVRVDGVDVTGVTLTLQPGMTGSGRLVFESANTPVPTNLSAMRMQLRSVPTATPGPDNTVSAQAADDGTFSMRGIVPGMYRFTSTDPAPWVLKSITMNGRDLTDRIVEVKPGDVLSNVIVTFTDQPSDVGGRLLDASGQPATGLSVILFTADRTFWGLQSRRTAVARPSPAGEFRFTGLLPGDYYISAVTDFDLTDGADPTFYEALVPASLRITVGAGDHKVQDLKLATQ